MTRPRRLTSLPGLLTGPEGPESLGSFVERTAAGQVLPAAVSTILVETRLLAGHHTGAPMPIGYGIDMSPEQRMNFAHACQLTPGELQTMLLRDLDGVAFNLTGLDLEDGNSVRAVGAREWAGFAGSACCPQCLRDTGGWRLRWRLWTSFVCLTHGRMLVDRCPRCERRTAVHRPGQGTRPLFTTRVPRLGHCGNSMPRNTSNPDPAGVPCGLDLRELPTLDLSAAPRLLDAQRTVNRVLEQRLAVVAGQDVPALTYFRHLRSLMALALHGAQPGDLGALPEPVADVLRLALEDRDDRRASEAGVRGTSLHPYKSQPADLRLVAAILPWAVEVLASPDQAGVTGALLPLVERSRVIRRSSVRALGRDFSFTGALATGLDEALAPRASFQRSMGHLAAAGTGSYRTFNPALVPHLIWKEDYERDFQALLDGSGIGETAARVTISLALVRLTGPHALPASVTLLGLDGLFKGTSSNTLVGHLGRTGGREAFQQALHGLATRLEGPGPHRDYRAAQAALADFRELDMDTWDECRNAAGLRPNKSSALRRDAAAWVWAQILSSHPHFSPALTAPGLRQDSVREVYRRFETGPLGDLEAPLRVHVRWLEGELGLV